MKTILLFTAALALVLTGCSSSAGVSAGGHGASVRGNAGRSGVGVGGQAQ